MHAMTPHGIPKIEHLAATTRDPATIMGQIIHDLRGPMATLVMELYSAKRVVSNLDEPERSRLTEILDNFERLNQSLGAYVTSLQRARTHLHGSAEAPLEATGLFDPSAVEGPRS